MQNLKQRLVSIDQRITTAINELTFGGLWTPEIMGAVEELKQAKAETASMLGEIIREERSRDSW